MSVPKQINLLLFLSVTVWQMSGLNFLKSTPTSCVVHFYKTSEVLHHWLQNLQHCIRIGAYLRTSGLAGPATLINGKLMKCGRKLLILRKNIGILSAEMKPNFSLSPKISSPMHICTFVCEYMCVYVCVLARVCVRVYVCVYACVRTCVYVCQYTLCHVML